MESYGSNLQGLSICIQGGLAILDLLDIPFTWSITTIHRNLVCACTQLCDLSTPVPERVTMVARDILVFEAVFAFMLKVFYRKQ